MFILRSFALLLGLATIGTAHAQSDRTPRDPAELDARRSPIVRVFEQARDAVVNVNTTRIQRVRMLRSGSLWDEIFDFHPPPVRERRLQSVGSGFVVHQSGFIVTNAHVVAQTDDVSVTFADNTTRPAEIFATDPAHDLAVLKVAADEPLPYLKLGRSDDILIGETVIAIGNPLGLQHTVTRGIVSALDRELRFSEDVVYRGLIQTDAAINPGNSGGPLLNILGELIGVNTAIRGDAQNVGFAIPVDRVWELLPQLLDIERRQRVRFGLVVAGPSTTIRAVRPDSPAAQAGVQPADRVIAFNGEPLRNAIDYYVHLLDARAGDEISLTLAREERTFTRSIAMEKLPLPDGAELARARLGLELVELSERLKRRYDLPASVGVIVQDVLPRSPADRAGLEPGDVLLRMDRLTVSTLTDVGLALESIPRGEAVLVDGARVNARRPFRWTVVIPTAGEPPRQAP